MFNGANMGLGNIAKLSKAVSRSITGENVYGEKGKAGMALPEECQDEVKKIVGASWQPDTTDRNPQTIPKLKPIVNRLFTTATNWWVIGKKQKQHMKFFWNRKPRVRNDATIINEAVVYVHSMRFAAGVDNFPYIIGSEGV